MILTRFPLHSIVLSFDFTVYIAMTTGSFRFSWNSRFRPAAGLLICGSFFWHTLRQFSHVVTSCFPKYHILITGRHGCRGTWARRRAYMGIRRGGWPLNRGDHDVTLFVVPHSGGFRPCAFEPRHIYVSAVRTGARRWVRSSVGGGFRLE